MGVVVLPPDLAPTLRAAAEQLLAEVPVVGARPAHRYDSPPPANRCVVCRRGGKLVGHHETPTVVVWVHGRCHTKLHRRIDARHP